MLDWEWYKNPNTCRIFVHCLLKANWKETTWRGITLKPGQFATSLATLSKETHLTVKQVRTALDHLKETGEISSETRARLRARKGQDNGQGKGQDDGKPKCRIITVIKWNEYQAEGKEEGKIMGNKRARKRAIDKEYKEYKNKRNIYAREKSDVDYDKLAEELKG
jgi:hypothetical protein